MSDPTADYGQVYHFTATCPAGTPQSAPVIVALPMPPRTVDRIYWRVPNGPMGTMGWQLSMGGVQVLPVPGGDLFVVANDEHDSWTPRGQTDSGAWQATMYNTGANPHSVYLAFHVSPPGQRGRAGLTFLTPAQLAQGPPLTADPETGRARVAG